MANERQQMDGYVPDKKDLFNQQVFKKVLKDVYFRRKDHEDELVWLVEGHDNLEEVKDAVCEIYKLKRE